MDETLRKLKRAAETRPQDNPAQYAYAQALARTGEIATATIERILQNNPLEWQSVRKTFPQYIHQRVNQLIDLMLLVPPSAHQREGNWTYPDIAAIVGRNGDIDRALDMLAQSPDPQEKLRSYFSMGIGLTHQETYTDAERVFNDITPERMGADTPNHTLLVEAVQCALLQRTTTKNVAATKRWNNFQHFVASHGRTHQEWLYNQPLQAFLIAGTYNLAYTLTKSMPVQGNPLEAHIVEATARKGYLAKARTLWNKLNDREKTSAFGTLAAIHQEKDPEKLDALWQKRSSPQAKIAAYCALAEHGIRTGDYDKAREPLEHAIHLDAQQRALILRSAERNTSLIHIGCTLAQFDTEPYLERAALIYYDLQGNLNAPIICEIAATAAKRGRFDQALSRLHTAAQSVRPENSQLLIDGYCTIANRLLDDLPPYILGGITNKSLRVGY